MSKLNSVIRLLGLIVGTINFFSGLGLLCSSAIVYQRSWIKLTPNYFKEWLVEIICCATFLLPITIFGCVGTVKQDHYEVRKTGRALLMVFQILLFLAMVACGAIGVNMRETADSLEVGSMIAYNSNGSFSAEVALQYDWFETILKGKVDAGYFQACTGDHSDLSFSFLKEYVVCYDESLYSVICTTECSTHHCPDGFEAGCCPYRESCLDGDMRFCPYDRCRAELNLFFLERIRPLGDFMLAVVAFQILLTILTCLLVCYYPADDLEQQLIKAGTIKKPKDYEKKKKSRQDVYDSSSSRSDIHGRRRIGTRGESLEVLEDLHYHHEKDHIDRFNEKLGNLAKAEKINAAIGNLTRNLDLGIRRKSKADAESSDAEPPHITQLMSKKVPFGLRTRSFISKSDSHQDDKLEVEKHFSIVDL